jgi:hypothetical protein
MSENVCLHESSAVWCYTCGAIRVGSEWRPPQASGARARRRALVAELERLQGAQRVADCEARAELAEVRLRRAVGYVQDVQRLEGEARAILDDYGGLSFRECEARQPFGKRIGYRCCLPAGHVDQHTITEGGVVVERW